MRFSPLYVPHHLWIRPMLGGGFLSPNGLPRAERPHSGGGAFDVSSPRVLYNGFDVTKAARSPARASPLLSPARASPLVRGKKLSAFARA